MRNGNHIVRLDLAMVLAAGVCLATSGSEPSSTTKPGDPPPPSITCPPNYEWWWTQRMQVPQAENAAGAYRAAAALLVDYPAEDFALSLDNWLKAAADVPEPKGLREWVLANERALEALQRVTAFERCFLELEATFDCRHIVPLDDQCRVKMTDLALCLASLAKLLVQEHRFGDAVRDLRTLMYIARHREQMRDAISWGTAMTARTRVYGLAEAIARTAARAEDCRAVLAMLDAADTRPESSRSLLLASEVEFCAILSRAGLDLDGDGRIDHIVTASGGFTFPLDPPTTVDAIAQRLRAFHASWDAAYELPPTDALARFTTLAQQVFPRGSFEWQLLVPRLYRHDGEQWYRVLLARQRARLTVLLYLARLKTGQWPASLADAAGADHKDMLVDPYGGELRLDVSGGAPRIWSTVAESLVEQSATQPAGAGPRWDKPAHVQNGNGSADE